MKKRIVKLPKAFAFQKLIYFEWKYEELRDIDNLDIQLTIDDQLFLEIILTEIRGKTISYATFKKRERVKLENTLTRDILKLEENKLFCLLQDFLLVINNNMFIYYQILDSFWDKIFIF
jgi:hypothetical protein